MDLTDPSLPAEHSIVEPKTVLAIDDDPIACSHFEAVLGAKGYTVVTESVPGRASALIREGDFDVILLDLVMPGTGGFEILAELQGENSTPVIVVTGKGSVEKAVEAMRLGASDFVTKPANGELLDLRIRRALEHERTRRLANTDGLTGLYNHRYFYAQLRCEVERAHRYERALTLLMVDLDRFKEFNDRFGHQAGDRALVEVAKVLMRGSRTTDLVARYGGEEFAVVLTETAQDAARFVAERLRTSVAQLRLDVDPSAQLTLSVGLCTLGERSSIDELIGQADRALYQAKQEGRDRVCITRAPARQPPGLGSSALPTSPA